MAAGGELAGFIDRFAPPMRARIRACRAVLRARYPRAVQLVYDNDDFLVSGLGPTDRPSQSIFSLAAQRSGVPLFLLQRATERPDPDGLPRGPGRVVRHVALAAAADLDAARQLDAPRVVALQDAALKQAAVPMSATDRPRLVIKSTSARQRPRR